MQADLISVSQMCMKNRIIFRFHISPNFAMQFLDRNNVYKNWSLRANVFIEFSVHETMFFCMNVKTIFSCRIYKYHRLMWKWDRKYLGMNRCKSDMEKKVEVYSGHSIYLALESSPICFGSILGLSNLTCCSCWNQMC